jgi:hypothetical protein
MHPLGRELLDDTAELDYLTHIVIRMYESKSVPFDDPERFRIEILFSPGASHDPFEMARIEDDHVLPPVPRVHMEDSEKVSGTGPGWGGAWQILVRRCSLHLITSKLTQSFRRRSPP